MVERDLEKEFKEDENPFRLAIVCAMWITGFDAPCVSTVYLDKPIKGHTLMQTIARANRVYDDEKENGLIVDYGNVYKQLEKAYSVYGEGGTKGGGSTGGSDGVERPFELLEDDVKGLSESIENTKNYLTELGFILDELTSPILKPMEKLGFIKKAVDCVCLNETTRTKYEVMAREVFRKYMALYPQEVIKPHIKNFNAIEAIYQQLNQQTKDADVTEIIKRLQQVVDDNVTLQTNVLIEPKEEVYVDLSKLDFDKLRKVFAATPKKKTVLFDLQRAVDKKMKQMLKDNPMRMEFYNRYKEIIEEYNRGKDLEDTMKSFDKLFKFVQDLNVEDTRALRENLDEEALAIFDLLRTGKTLTTEELKEVKKISVDTLSKLKEEKLKIERWRESRQITAQVNTMIFDSFQWLPQNAYTDNDVKEKATIVYQHIYTNYGNFRMGASA
jgi:type I restriction enzyme R subunit